VREKPRDSREMPRRARWVPWFDLTRWPEVRKPDWGVWITLKVKIAPVEVECLETNI
jgi:hypothetical protein